jgi:glycerol-3-phosphate O-acyltransferase
MTDNEKDLLKQFHDVVDEMRKNVDADANRYITPENIFQPALMNNREIFSQFLETLIMEESGIEGKENLLKFHENFKNGVSSLILAEHKSNFDVPVFYKVMHNEGEPFKGIFEDIVFIAGRKLNEEESFVKIMAEQFNRVMVAPKSELVNADEEERDLAVRINLATQKFIRDKRKDYIFLVFPTGTRSKPWDRSTYNGIREVFSYIRGFDQMIFMSINGNCMVPRQGPMSQEPPRKDVIKLIFSEPRNTKEWIAESRKLWEESDKSVEFKQFGINRVMDKIYEQKGVMPWNER